MLNKLFERQLMKIFNRNRCLTTPYLSIVLFLTISIAYPNETAEIVKNQLQHELTTHYLKKVEMTLGTCGDGPATCLSQKNNHMVANFPSGDICFPYTMCGFYHCMENVYHCNDVGVNYFTKLAFPTCSAYEANIEKKYFSDQAIEWIYTVMVCLQKGLVDECELNGHCPKSEGQNNQKKTCDHITEFTLQYHPRCYIFSGVGVCHLSFSDKMAIWKTVNPFMTAREKQEAYKVIFECFRPKT
jgi:hypothetical protein